LLQALPTGDEELYTRFKKLEAHREFLNLQEASPYLVYHVALQPGLRTNQSDDSCCYWTPISIFTWTRQEYILYETHNLRRELLRAQEEVKRIKSVPLVIGQFLEAIDGVRGIVGSTTGSNYVVRILSTLDRELLKPSSSVALHRHSNALVDILPPEADSSITMLGVDEKPNVKYEDVGGLDSQKQEIREAVELPLTQVSSGVICLVMAHKRLWDSFADRT
jgi:26S proteasome regulatory subunit T3